VPCPYCYTYLKHRSDTPGDKRDAIRKHIGARHKELLVDGKVSQRTEKLLSDLYPTLVHPDNLYVCKYCDATFATITSFNAHLVTHVEFKENVCFFTLDEAQYNILTYRFTQKRGKVENGDVTTFRLVCSANPTSTGLEAPRDPLRYLHAKICPAFMDIKVFLLIILGNETSDC